MQQIHFNDNWSVSGFQKKRLVDFLRKEDGNQKKVRLPHDAMIAETPIPDTRNAGQTGFYPGGFYTYKKLFFVPEDWNGKEIILEFEGVYMNSQVFINDSYAGGHSDGYSCFYVKANDFLKYGTENEILVHVNNEAGLNSRWYSGSGIYRNVHLWVGEKIHIPLNGLRITAPDAESDYTTVNVDVKIVNQDCRKHKICIHTIIFDECGCQAATEITDVTMYSSRQESIRQHIGITKPKLWDCDAPSLYRCSVTIYEGDERIDSKTESFGIRKLQLDPFHGFRLNGRPIKLRGACIHHDNGIIGACTLKKAEYRRCRQLKEAGFNCLRSSHHPMSKSMLDACDSMGMLVMDELSDMWNRRKNQNDAAEAFNACWEEDVESMVFKDLNHPSVILYSTGNEIPEAGSEHGAWLNRQITNKIRGLDDTRFITNAINGNIAIMDELMTVLNDIAEEKGCTVADIIAGKSKADCDNGGGSNGLNALMALLMGEMGDKIASHPVMTRRLKEFVDAMDIAGYNYMTGRHASEGEQSPNRIVLGTETFPSEIVRLWEIVKQNSFVIGDMTWTGYDYLGESGLGICYYDGTNNFAAKYPDRLAYCGDIDLIGHRRCISYLRETVFGKRKVPYIAVERLNRYGEPVSKTPWSWKDNISSWTWPGYEEKPAKVDIISDAEEVELFLNGRSCGKKEAGEKNGFFASYEITYHPGELKAVCYRNGKKAEYSILSTAGDVSILKVDVDGETLTADGEDLSFITIGLADTNGRENLFAENEVTITAEGAGHLIGFGSANPQYGGSFLDTAQKTYDGYIMAVVRAGTEKGDIRLTLSSPGCKTEEILIHVV